MPTCPSCGTENDAGTVLCKNCGVSIGPPLAGTGAAGEGAWGEVYSGHGAPLRGMEEELERRGITAVRMPVGVGAAFEVGIFGTDEGSNYILAVPPDQYE